nr:hypothetical protein [Tanacetum cinerariifolium]
MMWNWRMLYVYTVECATKEGGLTPLSTQRAGSVQYRYGDVRAYPMIAGDSASIQCCRLSNIFLKENQIRVIPLSISCMLLSCLMVSSLRKTLHNSADDYLKIADPLSRFAIHHKS